MFQFSFPILFKWTSGSIKCLLTSVKFASSTPSVEVKMVRVLNVAEKNDAAKSLADIMSRGRYSKREGFSRFNKIYEFPYTIFNQNCQMTMTSVSGHLLNYEFVGQYKKWYGCSPVALFDAPVEKKCPQDYVDIMRTLEREARGCQILIVWTDCDREGENIGFEVIQVCTAVKSSLTVYRARFSEITPQAVTRALSNLVAPDRNVSDAVDIRQELDLRIGAAFTRFQTLRLKQVFPDVLADQLISYGSCQFPTLGFVVERYKQVQAFIAEPFWKIKVLHDSEEGEVEFAWKRQRLFDHLACLVLYQHCLEKPQATVVEVSSKPKSKWRPVALDTVELEKLASRKLRIGAKETMKIAEKLYTQGYISYPRTETNMFPKDFDLRTLVGYQTQDPNWGGFANALLERGPTPRNGNKTDQAHPPIHPTKYASNLQGNEKTIYEFVVRHFLACCSQDAQGQETIVEIDINEERFSISGLMILARNYLDVYPYDKWNAKVIPTFLKGDVFQPKSIEMNQGETSPPSLLTEADLIALMEKHGIGTDATHAEHIETIKSRLYVGVRNDGKFVPGELGMGLVEGYDAMGYEMSKPNLRAELEQDLKRICDGQKDKNVVLSEQIQKYKQVFIEASRQVVVYSTEMRQHARENAWKCLEREKSIMPMATKLDEALSQFFGTARPITSTDYQVDAATPVCPCPQCGQDMVIKTKKDGVGLFLTCMGYPNCRNAIWFPAFVLEATVDDSFCDVCENRSLHRIQFKFKPGSVPPYIPNEYVSCIGGCDQSLNETLGCTLPRSTAAPSGGTNNANFDSGFGSDLSAGRTTDFDNTSTIHSTQSTTGPSQRWRQSQLDGSSGSAASGTRPGMMATNQGNRNRPSQSSDNSFQRGIVRPLASHNNAVVCHCGDDARLLTVRKEGPNTGRQFYACAKPADSKCDFFLWADNSETSTDDGVGLGFSSASTNASSFPRPQSSYQPSTSANARNSDVKCGCGNAAKLLTVQKDGPNKGKQFYSCAKPFGQERCNFFQWSDDSSSGPSGPSTSRFGGSNYGATGGFGGTSYGSGRGGKSFGHGRGGGKTSGARDTEDSAPKRKRKCGLCGEEGHTKNKCPHKR